jgi:CRP-like cAMP-binding protein
MDSPRTLLSLLDTLAPGPLPEQERVQASITVRVLPAGATVFHQDTAHAHVHAVQSGLVKLAYLGEDGTEWIKSFIAEGGFFASLAALAPGGRTTFLAAALEPSRIEGVPHAVLEDLASRHLVWSRALQALAMLHAARKEQRERELLTLGAEARYRRFVADHPGLHLRVPQKDLARHLGVTPVGFNRIVKRVRQAAA